MRCSLLFVVFFSIGTVRAFFGSKQSIAVQGRLICKGQPASGVKVKLYDEGLLTNKRLAQTKTNNNGEFYLQGTKREITTIDPQVKIYHRCDHFGLCFRQVGIEVPKSHVSSGDKPKKVYDIGTINLQNKFAGEKKECIT